MTWITLTISNNQRMSPNHRHGEPIRYNMALCHCYNQTSRIVNTEESINELVKDRPVEFATYLDFGGEDGGYVQETPDQIDLIIWNTQVDRENDAEIARRRARND